ncbi:hypothetical protein CMV_024832 [Castanea mollissima]|uniref:Uncharacterized protein n=1 Tax=Castanea mollissima TaxID=60419 RepID=A0A8J4QQV9_9ROSI|nr:hypothetical protein CMV_024832 [Castanea mollissima]
MLKLSRKSRLTWGCVGAPLGWRVTMGSPTKTLLRLPFPLNDKVQCWQQTTHVADLNTSPNHSIEVAVTRSRGGGDELQGGGDDGDLELRSMTSFRHDGDLELRSMTSFRHDGGAMGQGLVLGFTSDTLSFLLSMGLA